QLGQQIFSQGSQLLTLRYSRKQETKADNLGIAYLKSAGYDPRAMSTVLRSLANQNALEARLMGSTTRVPEWASTHPDPASRVGAALNKAGANASGAVNRETFLTGINGLLYGDDPKQGVVDGAKFIHPDLRLTFQAPQGYYLVNGTRAVTIGGQSGKGQFTTAAYSGDLDAYVRAQFTALGQSNQMQLAPQQMERTTVNGLPAAYGVTRVAGQGGQQLDVVVFAYEMAGNRAYHFLTMSPAGGAGNFNAMFQSMRRITADEAAAVRARKVQVVTVKAGDTVQSLASRMAYADAPLDRFLVLNGLQANSTLQVGSKVKLVTY
ncbi:MAG: M48 family metalloprotease, partial [Novosphingobium sp.]